MTTGIKFYNVHCNVWYEDPIRLYTLDSLILSLFSMYFKSPIAASGRKMVFALSCNPFPVCLLKYGSHSHAYVY
jgi:hypothetical protein